MKLSRQIILFGLILISIVNTLTGQCNFQYISNDTVYQDYIDFIYAKKNADEIVTIGCQINRGNLNDSIYNATVFQTFDYCGNKLSKVVYHYIGNCLSKRIPLPTHSTYKEEPIGNSSISFKENEFLIADKAVDTILKQSVMVLYHINADGNLLDYKTITLNDHEANHTTIKNVLQLKDGKIIVILWDYLLEFNFYYFDENLNFITKKVLGLTRGMRTIKEVDNGEFIFTSLASDNSSFQFYRTDTMGNVKWTVNPYTVFGSARDVQIKNNKIYVTGGIMGFGIFLICDMNGSILKQFKYDSFYCQPRFCSAYIDSDNSFILGGYIQHCQSSDSSGSDISIIKIDSNGTMLWNKLYDFRSALGTYDSQGHYNDYGGFKVDKTNDGGYVTNGMSRYSRLSPGGVSHEDALLIKTIPLMVTQTKNLSKINYRDFELLGNLLQNELKVTGPIDLIKYWAIYTMNGKKVLHGLNWIGYVKLSSFEPGLYFIKLIDGNDFHYLLKFIKN